MYWGLLGPEKIVSERRTRSLGIAASIRSFNDLAVPGLGGVWFGRQIFTAVLGLAVAEHVRSQGNQIQNIRVANAVEALSCWLGLHNNGWQSDQRLRGATKMFGKSPKHFADAGASNFYVTQPMRMATVQTLPSLGFVETSTSRFNSFKCTGVAHNFIQAVCPEPVHYSQNIISCLSAWVHGQLINVDNPKISKALSMLETFPEAGCGILSEQLIQGSVGEKSDDKERRRAACLWIEGLRNNPAQEIDWKKKPNEIDIQHWHDLHAGALFFLVREAAIQVLDELEKYIANTAKTHFVFGASLPEKIIEYLNHLRQESKNFLDKGHNDSIAKRFCKECVDEGDEGVLGKLVKRDGQVLRLTGKAVVPGPAFNGGTPSMSEEQETSDTELLPQSPLWPAGISPRISNLFLLNADLHQEIDKWI